MVDNQAVVELMFAEDLLEVEEFVLYDAFAPRPKNPAFPYWKYKHLNIDELTCTDQWVSLNNTSL